MDQFGSQLTPMMGIRKRSPAAREDRLSFFQEINQEQLAKYRPDQVAHILRQRENVRITPETFQVVCLGTDWYPRSSSLSSETRFVRIAPRYSVASLSLMG